MQVNQPKEGGAQHNPAASYQPVTITAVPEKLCRKCGECWPADTEFFFRQASCPDGLGTMCKACYAETPSMIKRNAGKKKLNQVSSPWETLFADAQEVQHVR